MKIRLNSSLLNALAPLVRVGGHDPRMNGVIVRPHPTDAEKVRIFATNGKILFYGTARALPIDMNVWTFWGGMEIVTIPVPRALRGIVEVEVSRRSDGNNRVYMRDGINGFDGYGNARYFPDVLIPEARKLTFDMAVIRAERAKPLDHPMTLSALCMYRIARAGRCGLFGNGSSQWDKDSDRDYDGTALKFYRRDSEEIPTSILIQPVRWHRDIVSTDLGPGGGAGIVVSLMRK